MNKIVLLAMGLGVCLPTVAWGDDPLTVTSDTSGYCLGLAERMEQAGSMPPQMRVLWEQGRALCERGHIRGGLMRLRRAMIIYHGAAE
jgi:hypothetical protein